MQNHIDSLTELLDRQTANEPEEAGMAILNDLLRNDYWAAVAHAHLATIQADIRLSYMLARQSYKHVNGFRKLTLFDDATGRFRLRLHVWGTTQSDSHGNVHNHRFHCSSAILKGQLANRAWALDEDTEATHSHHLYIPRQEQESYTLRFIGGARPIPTLRAALGPGKLYHQASHELHTSEALEPGTLTLFIEDRLGLRDGADVFSKRYPWMDMRVEAPSLSPTEYKAELGSFLKLWSGA